jgi:hypothetical protein
MKSQPDLPLHSPASPDLLMPAEPVQAHRLIDLVATLGDNSFALGPLDRQDLQSAICELLERRNLSAEERNVAEGMLFGKDLREAVSVNRRLWRALDQYRTCRHGCLDCTCTADARQVLGDASHGT